MYNQQETLQTRGCFYKRVATAMSKMPFAKEIKFKDLDF